MQRQELIAQFDQQAAGYDRQWAKLAPIRDAIHLLIGALMSELADDARILCIGAGTGAEMFHFAQRFPRWRFTAVEPSGGMLDVCRRRAQEQGVAERCTFHQGYLDSLPPSEPFDGAMALLVSQFILDRQERTAFFRSVAERLRPGGYLVSSDLASDTRSAAYGSLLEVWSRMMTGAEVAPEAIARMREAYARDVAVLPPSEVSSIIEKGGFMSPVQFFQAGLIHGWYSVRA